jgi:hypothetical protein
VPGGPGAVTPIAAALRLGAGLVRLEGVVTTAATLLDASGRRILVQDGSGAVEVLLPVGAVAPRPGTRIRVEGDLGLAYGAPRVKAAAIAALGRGSLPAPRPLAEAPGTSLEGRLVRVQGTVLGVKRLGDRWRAEVRTSRTTIVVAGLAGAGIPAATLREGATATIVGVVRRPHPTASDRRFAVVPRSPADVRVASGSASGATGSSTASAAAGGRAGTGAAQATPPPATDVAVDADLARLGGLAGRRERGGRPGPGGTRGADRGPLGRRRDPPGRSRRGAAARGRRPARGGGVAGVAGADR